MVDVKAIQAEVTKKWGKGLSFIAGSKETLRINAISTGSLKLDVALGIGGMPRGRIVEIYGPESSGKTTICQTVIAEAQLLGLQCAFIDVEHALDLEYTEVCGVNIDKLLMSQPDSAEQALDLVEIYAKHGVQVIVVDSVAALVPKAEIEGEMGDAHMALTARLMSQGLRKLKKIISDTGSLLIFTNQLRHKIGVMFGSPETTTGGQALKFYASVRIDLRKRAPIQENNEAIGNIVRAKIVKSKVAPPFRECEFQIRYNEGIDTLDDMIYFIDEGMVPAIEKGGGGNYTIDAPGGTVKVRGREKLRTYLESGPDLENVVRRSLRLPMIEETQ